MTPDAFPWDQAMRFGFGVLRLSPEQFWGLTLPELRAALSGSTGGHSAGPALPRDALATLMARFPDAHFPRSEKDQT